jgi:uncharacterized protein
MNLFRILLVLVVFFSLNLYLFVRGWQALPGNTIIHIVYSILFLVATFSFFLGVFLSDRFNEKIGILFEQIGGYWIIFFVFFLLAALFGDIVRLADHFLHIIPSWFITHYAWLKLGYLAAILIFLTVISITGYYRFSNPRAVELNLAVTTENNHPDSLSMLAASDLHLGNIIRKKRLSDWVSMINHQHPDIILLAGDVFDRNFKAVERQHMDEELAKLKARYGVYAVLGNHEYYMDTQKAVQYLERSGIKLLRDETVTIDNRFIIIGRDDATNRNRKTLDSLMAGLNPNLPRILLDHQPSGLRESVKHKIDLHISGHTHNGQIFPFSLITSKVFELAYGYRKMGDTHVYVTSGLGLWGAPIRFGTQSEIVRIKLKANAK